MITVFKIVLNSESSALLNMSDMVGTVLSQKPQSRLEKSRLDDGRKTAAGAGSDDERRGVACDFHPTATTTTTAATTTSVVRLDDARATRLTGTDSKTTIDRSSTDDSLCIFS